MGQKIDDKLVPVDEKTTVSGIQGYVLKPDVAKRSRGMQFFFVNGRFVKSSFLHHAIKTAYEGLLAEGVYPGYFIFFDLEPHTIDINIHPTKTEVKFENEQSLYAILRSAIKHSLGMFQIAPTLDFDRDPNLDLPYQEKGQPTQAPKIEVDRDFNPFSFLHRLFLQKLVLNGKRYTKKSGQQKLNQHLQNCCLMNQPNLRQIMDKRFFN